MSEGRTVSEGQSVSARESLPWSPARTWLAAGLTAAVLGLAVVAGVLATSVASGPLIFVETLSARISGVLLSLGARAPFGYALVAGMVASVNPCGFVLLPAYLGLYLGDERGVSGRRPVGRAIVVSVTVTASFVLLFGLAGIIASLAASAVTPALPWIGATVGAGLILLGGFLASGRELDVPLGPRAAHHLKTAARSRGIGGYAAYGVAYGLASLGCTLPVFLGVVGTSLQLHGMAGAVAQFVLFGIGMGAVLASLTILTAWFGEGLVTRMRSLAPYIGWVSAVILWLAGAYVVYYWLIAIRLL
jgi:cytochrome c biogenesis protein CcdA